MDAGGPTDREPIGPERLYSLPELAAITGRSYEFWDEECRSDKLSYLQRGRGGKRFVPASSYDSWFMATVYDPGAGEVQAEHLASVTVAPARRREWVDFEA
jgi:hypothetical protein